MVSSTGLNIPLSLPELPIRFVNPAAFILLCLMIVLYVTYRRSLRGLPPGRRLLVLGLRVGLLILIVTAIAKPLWALAPDSSATAFLVDVSDSVSAEQQHQAMDWVRQAAASKHHRDQLEIIAFAKDAVIDRQLGGDSAVQEITSTPTRDRSNLANAIRLAISTLPSNAARQIIVLSDGMENAGHALDEARLARAAGIPISFVALPKRGGPEVLVRQVETSGTLREHDVFNVVVDVASTIDTQAVLHLTIDGRVDSSRNVQLKQGDNTFSIEHQPLAIGFHSLEVQLDPSNDTIAENNIGVSYTSVIGKAKVLLVEGTADGGHFLAAALTAGGMEVDVRDPFGLPPDAASLRDFDSVTLLNLPASKLSDAQQLALKSYVQSLGGGLIVIGGDRSYGVGGYAKTPLEDLLPVRMDLRGRNLQSSVALLIVMDTSGSMGEGPAGATKIDLAKKAALESVALLGEQDQIGILAFEDASRWVVEPTFLADPNEVKRKINTLSSGGGTDMFPALKEAYRAMSQRQAKVRHIILMTDGLAPPGDYETITAQMRRDNITLSTIAVGTDADFGLLQQLAESGRGRYYEGLDPFDVPQLTVKETLEVSRAAIVEEPVQPIRANRSVILEGIDINDIPQLSGYVATTPKPSATSILVSKELDPLLIEWQYGLGQVIAWTSDAENRWATDWLGWQQFSQFWTQAVKRTIPAQIDRNVQLSVQHVGTNAKIVADARNEAGDFLNLLESEANVVTPDNSQVTVTLRQSAPGRYEGLFPISQQGAYMVQLSQRGDNGAVVSQLAGFVVPYSSEYRELSGDLELLSALADQTAGRALSSPAQAFLQTGRIGTGGRELWPFLTALAIVLFLVDIAARRLRVSSSDVRRGWLEVREMWRERSQPIGQPASERLLTVKQRIANSTIGSSLLTPKARKSSVVSKGDDPTKAGTVAPPEASELRTRLLEAKRRANR